MSTTLLEDRSTDSVNATTDPLRVMFIITTLEVGGAETLLVNLVRRLDRRRVTPEICCLKAPGQLGVVMAEEVPLFDHLLGGKYDVRVFGTLEKTAATAADRRRSSPSARATRCFGADWRLAWRECR